MANIKKVVSVRLDSELVSVVKMLQTEMQLKSAGAVIRQLLHNALFFQDGPEKKLTEQIKDENLQVLLHFPE